MAGLTKAQREDRARAASGDTQETVAMIRDEPLHDGGPTTADVHPDEVAGMQAHGWRVANEN